MFRIEKNGGVQCRAFLYVLAALLAGSGRNTLNGGAVVVAVRHVTLRLLGVYSEAFTETKPTTHQTQLHRCHRTPTDSLAALSIHTRTEGTAGSGGAELRT